MNINKINKYIEFAATKLKIALKENNYISDGYKIKYILEKNDSDSLIIVFSGFTRIGLKARYNYNRTLKNVKANKIFILDDFGNDNRGAYYLGKNMDFKIKDAVFNLINKIKEDLNIKKSIFIGSSKGGYASLYFGLQEKDSIIIAGAPQYYLAKYLSGTENYIENCLKYIIGDELKQESLNYLDSLLPTIVKNNTSNNCKVYLHYSDQENTYKRHIKFLIKDLSIYKYKYELDVKKYENHSDVSLYFPDYIKSTINKVLQ